MIVKLLGLKELLTCDDPAFGTRPLKRIIQKEVQNELTLVAIEVAKSPSCFARLKIPT
jgi:ATP-dependent Clp protease ATP-binding subunit ClpA